MKEKIKRITPLFILLLRRKYLQYIKRREMEQLKSILRRYINVYIYIYTPTDTEEEQNRFDYLKNNLDHILPFPFHFSEKHKSIRVYRDVDSDMGYVLHNDKRLYFMKGADDDQIKRMYASLTIEQEQTSPHRYESESFCVKDGDIVADIGASVGDFALSVIDRVKKIYLFEADKKWGGALQKTFAPWKEKVEIINKYVSDVDDEHCIKLDTFFENKPVDFIKADIEGAEQALLRGAKDLLNSQRPLKIVLCTYHYQKDEEVLNQELIENGFQTHFSDGYVLLALDKLTPPYLRKALVRGVRK
jgi:hypothetical protein